MNVFAVNSHYPCCGRLARFHPEEQKPEATIYRVCAHCKVGWYITRIVVSHGNPRLDDLVWRPEDDVVAERREDVYVALCKLEREEHELPAEQFASEYGPDADRGHGFRAIDVAKALPDFHQASWKQLYDHLESLTQEGRIHRANIRFKSQQISRYRTIGG